MHDAALHAQHHAADSVFVRLSLILVSLSASALPSVLVSACL